LASTRTGELRAAVARLEATYDKARADLVRGIERDGYHFDPEDARDSNGRYILLDALTVLVQAHTALATAQPDQGG
jgi:hypothetical protein